MQISAHKTNQAFCAAQLALDQEDYGWLQQFLSLRSTFVGGKNAHFFFFTSKPSSCKNLNQYFQEAWRSMGLPGTPTFTDLRTSIATHAKNTHCPENRHKVAQFMCHDTSTVDRFYALNLNAKQASQPWRVRTWRLCLGNQSAPLNRASGQPASPPPPALPMVKQAQSPGSLLQ